MGQENILPLPLKCPLCDGTKELGGEPCPFCKGTGQRPTDEEISRRKETE